MQANIKRVKKRDFEEIEMLLKMTFESDSVAEMLMEFKNTSDFVPELTRVARINDQIIGVIIYSHVQIAKGKKITDTISMVCMAVLPAYQNLGIGGELIRNSFAKARELEYQSVIVMGYEGYYPRFGFKPTIEFDITCPFDVPEENFMALELFPDTLSVVSGKVKYPVLLNLLPTYTT